MELCSSINVENLIKDFQEIDVFKPIMRRTKGGKFSSFFLTC